MVDHVQPQVYLFVVWQKGRKFESRIREDLSAKFRILKEYEVSWNRWQSIRNFSAFYRHAAFFSWLRKCWVCGTGPFRVMMVEDRVPEGFTGENARIVAAKHLYREWAGKRWRVHSSVSLEETQHQYRLLTGRSLEDFVAEAHDGTVTHIRIDRPLEYDGERKA